MFRRIRAKNEIEEIRRDLIRKLGVPPELIGPDKVRIVFSVPNRKNSQITAGAGYTIKGKKQILYAGTPDDLLAGRARHELGHYVFFNVAGNGDQDKRGERFRKRHNFGQDLKRDLTTHDRNHIDAVQNFFGKDGVTSTVDEAFACFCALIYSKTDFSQMRMLQNSNNRAYSETLLLSQKVFDQPDADVMLDVLERLIPAEVIPENQRRAVNVSRSIAARAALEGRDKISVYSHFMGEYLAAKMHEHSRLVGIKEVSDKVLGLGNYVNLPPEIRIGTETYHPRTHLAFLHSEFWSVKPGT